MSADSPIPDGSHSPSLVDWKVAEDVVGGDAELLLQVVDAFLQEAPMQLAALLRAVELSDAATLRRAAHTLKSSLRYFGARQGYDLALKLETAGQSGQMDSARADAGALQPMLERILGELREFHQRGGRQ